MPVADPSSEVVVQSHEVTTTVRGMVGRGGVAVIVEGLLVEAAAAELNEELCSDVGRAAEVSEFGEVTVLELDEEEIKADPKSLAFEKLGEKIPVDSTSQGNDVG